MTSFSKYFVFGNNSVSATKSVPAIYSCRPAKISNLNAICLQTTMNLNFAWYDSYTRGKV